MTTTDEAIGNDCEFICVVKVFTGQVAHITLRPRTKIRVTDIRIMNSGRWEVRGMWIRDRKVPLPRRASAHDVSPWDDYVMEVVYVGIDPQGEMFHAQLIGARVGDGVTT